MTHIITIDGPAASGKGTLARKLADHMDYFYLDTGAMYRLIGLAVLNANIIPEDSEDQIADMGTDMANGFQADMMANPDLKRDDVGQYASRCASLPKVRLAVLDLQRSLANNPPENAQGSVLDGRDCGTVVCPEAAVKIYITADVNERAKRRHAELQSKGIDTPFEEVLDDMKMRDDRDMNRTTAPLKPADDATILDTSSLTIDNAFAVLKRIVEKQA
ncbi:MAG: cytidylate kinase [Alphaproteobacteria bacterium]|nr:MAG: cytidylate kinase [Alphaproteobacteria bacterium]